MIVRFVCREYGIQKKCDIDYRLITGDIVAFAVPSLHLDIEFVVGLVRFRPENEGHEQMRVFIEPVSEFVDMQKVIDSLGWVGFNV